MFTSKAKDLYFKTFRICNVWSMDVLSSKVVFLFLSVTYTGLEKHTSLLQKQYIMNS